jgi:hypothetical protein
LAILKEKQTALFFTYRIEPIYLRPPPERIEAFLLPFKIAWQIRFSPDVLFSSVLMGKDF